MTTIPFAPCPPLASISENLGPTFFLSLLGACFLMIVVGAIVDRMPERAAGDDENEAGAKIASQAERRRAKAEAKASKKKAKLARTLAKKGKAPAVESTAKEFDEGADAAKTITTLPASLADDMADIAFEIEEKP